MAETTGETITATWREESARLVGALTRMTRDLDLAEDLAQDALMSALESWPTQGIPDNPGAWLMTTAKRRAVDSFRRADNLRRKTEELGHGLSEEDGMPDLTAQVDFIEDDVLRLIFLSCHPQLSPESRAALTLRLVGGLATAEIARGFLAAETAMGQRISRAKKTLSEARVDFELPVGAERTDRLDDVMAVVYLIFNEGYTATAGDAWMRPELTNEAIRLARMLAELMPDEPEVHGLQALLELQASRAAARVDAEGRPVLLDDQDRSLWDELLIRRGLAALERAELLAARGKAVGRYYLQAAIASRHARAATPQETDWRAIAKLYDVLAEAAPGPIVEVNRAVAHGRAFDPESGLAILDGLPGRALAGSHLLPSVRADLLARAGRHADAAASFREAASLTSNRANNRCCWAAPRSPRRRAQREGDPFVVGHDSSNAKRHGSLAGTLLERVNRGHAPAASAAAHIAACRGGSTGVRIAAFECLVVSAASTAWPRRGSSREVFHVRCVAAPAVPADVDDDRTVGWGLIPGALRGGIPMSCTPTSCAAGFEWCDSNGLDPLIGIQRAHVELYIRG